MAQTVHSYFECCKRAYYYPITDVDVNGLEIEDELYAQSFNDAVNCARVEHGLDSFACVVDHCSQGTQEKVLVDIGGEWEEYHEDPH